MPNCLVNVENVSMRFNLAREKVDSLKEYVVKALQRQLFFEEFWALSEVSFTLDRGEIMGIIGPNGAGKSTLMRLVAGVLQPTLGQVTVNGSIAPLLELGTGFDYDLTGNENIYLNGAVLGHSTEYMRERHEEILDFAELRDFADVPLKNYSSGMCARLGFAIATMVQPDLLIADEILGVGDASFQIKCEERIRDMIRNGTSVILVSHSIDQVSSMCSKALLLHKGRMVQYGRVAGH